MFYQEINVQNMNVELVAQMFQNYQSNVLFHLEGRARFVEDAYISFQYTDAAWKQRRTASRTRLERTRWRTLARTNPPHDRLGQLGRAWHDLHGR